MRKIGYARVSSPNQNLDRQIAALRAEGCDDIFREKASGKTMRNRPELEKAIDALGTDDVLVIAEWDRATRSMDDGLKIIARLEERGAMAKVLDRSYLDLTTPTGRGLIALLSSIAEDERLRIQRRAKEGMEIARADGRISGRPKALTEHQQKRALERLAAGEAAATIARDMGCHRSTISRLK